MNEYYHQCCIIIFLPEINLPDEKINLNDLKSIGNNVHEITKNFPVTKHLFYNHSIEYNDGWEDENYSKFLKVGDNIGERMENAFKNAFDSGFRKVILIHPIVGDLNTQHIQESLMSLKFIEFSIGPNKIGGYYLIGMNQFEPIIFRNKDWKSELLFKETVRDIGNLKYALYKLPILK